MQKVQPEDLLHYGLIPEFIGRLPVIATLDELSEDALCRILTEPKNSILRQYKKLFEMDDIELEVDEKALCAVARRAIERKSGARGLRSILENVLTDIMFEAPSRSDIRKVIVTEETIEGGQPKLISA